MWERVGVRHPALSGRGAEWQPPKDVGDGASCPVRVLGSVSAVSADTQW